MLFFSMVLSTAVFAKLHLPEDLPSKPNRLENAIPATGWIKSTRTDDKCSGFFISEDGYYATALHCLEECLRINDQYPHSDPNNDYDHPGPTQSSDFHKIFQVNRLQGKKPIICPDLHMTFPGGKWETYGDGQIVAIGRGWATVKNDGIDQLSEKQFELLKDSIDDYAILKFKVDRKLNCLSIGSLPQKDNTIWTLGFPTLTSRQEGFNSDGRSRYSSIGNVRSTILEDTFLQSLEMTPLDWTRQQSLTDDPKYLLMTNDVVSQMSGGAVLDENGNAVAIVYSSTAKDSLKLPFWGTGLAMRLDYVNREAEKQMGFSPFTCRN